MVSGITKRYFLPTLSSTPEQLFLLHFTQVLVYYNHINHKNITKARKQTGLNRIVKRSSMPGGGLPFNNDLETVNFNTNTMYIK